MPPKHVQTIRQLIYWQYAELIAKAAGFERNGEEERQTSMKG